MARKELIKNLPALMRNLYETNEYFKTLPSEKDLCYEENYWCNIEDPDGKKRNRLDEREQFLDDIKYIIKFIKELKAGKILDIGCGLGWLLSALNDSWEKYGIELSKVAIQYAQKYGSIFNGTLLDYPCEDNFFDLIVMHHVIEHMKDPVLNLKKIKNILKNKGLLILGTPDFDCGCARLFKENYRLLNDQSHISLFSNDSMHRFLRDYNFKIIHVEYPFFETRFFTKENLMKLFETSNISPPFYGNFMTFFTINQKDDK